nr:YlbF family regulator [Polycladospora coralii]
MTDILLDVYDLADQINESDEMHHYLRWKMEVERDEEAQKLIKKFQHVKERFMEAQRFGIFHPNYHQAKEEMESYQSELKGHRSIGQYLAAEDELDRLLSEVMKILAHTVSRTIKVPLHDPSLAGQAKRSCSSGS